MKSCVIYLTKKNNFCFLSNCRYCADRAQSLPWPALNIWLTTFQISSKSVHFRRSYSRPREGLFWALWVNPVLAQSDTSLWANNIAFLSSIKSAIHFHSIIQPFPTHQFHPTFGTFFRSIVLQQKSARK